MGKDSPQGRNIRINLRLKSIPQKPFNPILVNVFVMADIIQLKEHRMFKEKQEIDLLYSGCHFNEGDCFGLAENECFSCEVPQKYPEIKESRDSYFNDLE